MPNQLHHLPTASDAPAMTYNSLQYRQIDQSDYSSRSTFSATQKFKSGFHYCNAATLIGELKTIRLEGYNSVEN